MIKVGAFFNKCPPTEEQPWSSKPGFDRFSGLTEEESYFRVAQLHDHDGNPLVMDFATQEAVDWERDVGRELRDAGYRLLVRPGSGTSFIRQMISIEEVTIMAEDNGLTLDDIKAEAQAES